MITYQYIREISLFRLQDYLTVDYLYKTYADILSYSTTVYNNITLVSPLINYDDYLNTYDDSVYYFLPSVRLYDSTTPMTGYAVNRDDFNSGTLDLHYSVNVDDGNLGTEVVTLYLSSDIVFPSDTIPVSDPLPDINTTEVYAISTIIYLDDSGTGVRMSTPMSDGSTTAGLSASHTLEDYYDYYTFNPSGWLLSPDYTIHIITNCCISACCNPIKYIYVP